MEPTATPIQPTPQPPPKRANLEVLELALQQTEDQGKTLARDLMGVEVQRAQFDQDYRIAKMFHGSRVFADLKNKTEDEGVATAMAKILIGRGWSMNTGDSMQFIYFNRSGAPEVRNEYIAARLKRAGWDWKIDHLMNGAECVGCVIWPSFNGAPLLDREGQPVSVGFLEADAKIAGLLDKDTPWRTYKKDMYFWKCIARLKRQYASDVLTGASFEGEYEDALAPAEETPRQGSLEEQERVKAKKLEEARRWQAERDAKRNGQPAPTQPAETKPDAAGEFFA